MLSNLLYTLFYDIILIPEPLFLTATATELEALKAELSRALREVEQQRLQLLGPRRS
jgi:hypothetical protein